MPKHQRHVPDSDANGHEYWYPAIIVRQAKRAKELFDGGLLDVDVRFSLFAESDQGYLIDFDRLKKDLEKPLRILLNRVNRSPNPRETVEVMARMLTESRAKNAPEATIRKRIGDLWPDFQSRRYAEHKLLSRLEAIETAEKTETC